MHVTIRNMSLPHRQSESSAHPTNATTKLCIKPTMQTKATALIQILRDALLEVERNSKCYNADTSSGELRNSILRAIDELELVRTGSHELQAA